MHCAVPVLVSDLFIAGTSHAMEFHIEDSHCGTGCHIDAARLESSELCERYHPRQSGARASCP